MMPGFENAAQLRELFLSCGMGFLLGAYYDVFRLWRCWLSPSRFQIFLGDCLYASTSAIVTFLFLLSLNGGVLRWFLFLGLFVGFLAYRKTVGSLLVKVVLRLLHQGEKLARKTEKQLSRLFAFFTQKAKVIFWSIFGRKNRKKFKKTLATKQNSVV